MVYTTIDTTKMTTKGIKFSTDAISYVTSGLLDETRKKGTKTLVALAVIAVAVYIGFTPLYELITPNGGVAGAVVGSSFGAIFVIILTMYLLNKQTELFPYKLRL